MHTIIIILLKIIAALNRMTGIRIDIGIYFLPFIIYRKYSAPNYDLEHRDADEGVSDQEHEAAEVSTTSERHEDKGEIS